MGGKKQIEAAIVGSGPAGLAAANLLASSGFSVTVFDELQEFGGMLAYGIPEFRIPLATVKQKIGLAKGKGISFVRKRITSAKALLDEFDFVLLAIGSGFGSKAGTKGEEKEGIIDALEFLLKYKLEKKSLVSEGEIVAVIGGGNSAVDAARAALRQGAEVTIIYRRTEKEMPAFREEIEHAKREGIKFEFLKCPIEYKGAEKVNSIACSEMVLSGPDSSGRRKPVETGSKCEYCFDKIILAIGQKPDFGWLEAEGIKTDGKAIAVDTEFKTSIDRVYAAGDCVTGPKTIAEATKTGMLAAQAIIKKAAAQS